MKHRIPVAFLGVLLASAVRAQPAGPASGVSVTAAGQGLYRSVAQVPSTLISQFRAMGDRVQKPGNERVTLSGTLTGADGSQSQVLIVMELGGRLNIAFTGAPGPQKIVFNGSAASVTGAVPSSNDLLESLVDDLPETLLLVGRPSPRLLGQRFSSPTGGLCDYYDVAGFGVAVKQAAPLIKRYCFDSSTALLRRVSYMIDPSRAVVTQFGNWTLSNGQEVPGTITRTVAGAQVFEFQAQSAAVSASVADGAFSLP